MGTLLQVRLLCADNLSCEKAFAAAADIILDLDSKMSLYHDSELTRLNAAAGRRLLPVSEDTYQVVTAALRIAAQTEGYFDPTIAPLLDAFALYSTPAGSQVTPPAAGTLAIAATLVNFRHVRIRKSPLRIGLTKPGIKLDLGGIAKGYALDKIAAEFSRLGMAAFALNFGGHLLVHNLDHSSEIQNPESGETLVTCRLTHGSLSASAQNQRFVRIAGHKVGHIINPRDIHATAEAGRIVLVYHDSAMHADAWSTALFFPDPDQFDRLSDAGKIVAWRFGSGMPILSRAAAASPICINTRK